MAFGQSKDDDKEEKKSSFIKYKGSLGIHYDYYSHQAINYGDFRPQYPSGIFRVNASASLSFGKYLTIPISINITNRKVLFTYPKYFDENIIDYIRNPKNNISINPRYKFMQAFIGTQTPRYSKLTTGDTRLFGVGFEMNPGAFILSASYGTSQIAIEPNEALDFQGAYGQKMMAFRIGVGKISSSNFVLNFVKVKDNINSVSRKPLYGKPIEGITLSPSIKVKLFKKLFLETETGASLYTNNLESEQVFEEDYPKGLDNLIKLNGTSQFGFSNISSVSWKDKKFMVGGEVRYISASFVPVGYRNRERDFIDYKLKTRLQLFKNKATINATAGIRDNNVQSTVLTTSRRFIGSIGLNVRFSKHFSFNGRFTNFGFENGNVFTQQEKIEITNNTYSLSPSYNFDTERMKHVINLNTSLTNYKQFQASLLDFVNTESKNVGLNYSLLFNDIPLTATLSGNYQSNKNPSFKRNIVNLGTSVGYKLLDKKLNLKLSLNYFNVNREGETPDRRFTANFLASYEIIKNLKIAAVYRMNRYRYGSIRPDAVKNEHRIQLSVNTSF